MIDPRARPRGLKFWECDLCAAKPGTPSLCEACLHNRELIVWLNEQRDRNIAKERTRRTRVKIAAYLLAGLNIIIAVAWILFG